MTQTRVGRRGLIGLGIGGAVGLATARWTDAVAQSAPFVHGVASGDPLADRVILWTRVTPSADAAPGSGIGPDVLVDWEVSTSPLFFPIVAAGQVTTGADRDHTVKVDVAGLSAGTDHWFRFRALGSTSQVGHTRTAPARGTSASSVRLGVVSCSYVEWGWFSAYRLLAQQDVDAVLHLGDYLYEYAPDSAVSGVVSPLARKHQPAHECLTLSDYRIRHAQYKLDTDLQALHAAHPVIAVWDDHEIANDTWREGAENHQANEGSFAARAEAARRAWREWLPVRQVDADPERIHRRFRFGDLVDLWMLDGRQYRDEQPTSAVLGYGSIDPAADDPSRSLLGTEQDAWLVEGLTQSDAVWKTLGNQTPFFPLAVGASLPSAIDTLVRPILDKLPLAVPPALYVDDWNGYRAERRHLTQVFAGLSDIVILTGDVHESFVSDIPAKQGDYFLTRKSVAVEFIVPAVSSPSIARGINQVTAPLGVGNLVDTAFELNLALANPWVKYHDGLANGFGVVDFTADRVQCDLWHLQDVTNPQATGRVAASWQSRRGSRRVTRASSPLPPRS